MKQLGHKSRKIRKFDTGADRSCDEGKLDFEAFLSPLVIERFAQYMHKHRERADGTLREGDNWQKGIPMKSYMKSHWRHFFDVWKGYRCGELNEEQLCAVIFNAAGMLHTLLLKKNPKYRPTL